MGAWADYLSKRYLCPTSIWCVLLLGQVHFAYSQAGCLDVGKIYVPHDVSAAWWSAILAHIVGPSFINCLIAGHNTKALTAGLAMFSVYLLKMLGWRRFTVPPILSTKGESLIPEE